MKTAISLDRHLGAQITKRRMRLKLDREALASALCVTVSQVEVWERGEEHIPPVTMFDVASALKCRVAAFYR